MKNILLLIFFGSCFMSPLAAQEFTRQDELRGSITPQRAWWDLQHYKLSVEVFPTTRSIKGENVVTFKKVGEGSVMQIDLQAPMQIDAVTQNGTELSFTSEGSAHFITLTDATQEEDQITILFSGTPKEAVNPPWDGGFTWQKDGRRKDFIATSNQGIGSSIWWPNKDHPADEPNRGIDLLITAPKDLTAVGNGRLKETIDHGDTKTWHWSVINPINNYGVNINIADYVHFKKTHPGLKGELDMDFWVLRDNIKTAKRHFKQALLMMEAFEHWFGPYPFYEDSFKLVEVPYLGMEHQSSVTYGNQYGNGYLGSDLSSSGWGMKFDFIIIHESGHEWFANNITNKDVADMWLHEGFTAYSENLYLDYHFGKEASAEYVIGTRRIIQNDRPIIGVYNKNNEGSSDMYYKGANILHTLRQLVEDDEKWRQLFVGINKEFYHQTVTTKQVEDYFSTGTGIDLTEFWEQYLRTVQIPKLEYKRKGNDLSFRYTNIIDGFDMPVIVTIDGKEEWIFPTSAWKTKSFEKPVLAVAVKDDFYITSEELK